jgi:alanine-glyoxylate transaminase / serine-glyoxylate transaminase / serine-pyruvate transaminase
MAIPLPTAFQRPLVVPEKKLMGAGPSDYPMRVRKALANPVLGHMHPETLAMMDDIKEGCEFLSALVASDE